MTKRRTEARRLTILAVVHVVEAAWTAACPSLHELALEETEVMQAASDVRKALTLLVEAVKEAGR